MVTTNQIEIARDLFEKAEHSDDAAQKLSSLEQAVDLLDSYLEEHPDLAGSDKNLILNLRRAHTRRLLTQLPQLHHVNMEVWFDYISLLIFKLKDEVTFVLNENPLLNDAYWDFIRLWRDELRNQLGKK